MPVSCAILAQTFSAESSTANKEAPGGTVIGMIGGPPGPSSSKGCLLICRPQEPTDFVLSFPIDKDLRKASSANV